MTMIDLIADAAYGRSGQYIARIIGRHDKFTFARDFIGTKEGKRGDRTVAHVDTSGLYEVRDVNKHGTKESSFVLVWEDCGGFRETPVEMEDAMAIAKQMDETHPHMDEVGRQYAIRRLWTQIKESEAKDPEGQVILREAVCGLGPGMVRRVDLTAARRAEIARLEE